MNKQSFILWADPTRREKPWSELRQFLRTLPTDIDVRITASPYKRDRSEAQRGLMWLWHTAEAEEFGMSKIESHHEFKRNYCLPILLRDDDEGRLRRMWAMMELAAEEIREQFIDMLSTSLLNVKQMAEALTEYDMVTARKGLAFPHPEDQWNEAMLDRMPAKYRRSA